MRPTQPLESSLSSTQQQQNTADRPDTPTNRPQRKCHWFRIFYRHKAVIAQPEPTESQHRQAEQEFWVRTLRKQRNLNFFTCFGVIAAGAAFVVLWLTLRENRKAIEFARQQAEAASTQAQTAQQEFQLSQRPWIVNQEAHVLTPLTFYPTSNLVGATVEVDIPLLNIGHSAGERITPWMALVPCTWPSFTRAVQVQQQHCNLLRSGKTSEVSADPDWNGYFLAPEATLTNVQDLTAPTSDILKYEGHWPGQPFQIMMAVVGCVDYQFLIDEKHLHHQTRFAFALSKQQGMLNFVAMQPIGVHKLQAVQIPEGNTAD